MKRFLCVGGPLDGEWRDLHPYQNSFLEVAVPGTINLIPADFDSCGKDFPPNALTVRDCAVYKRIKIRFQQPGVDLHIEVLAYYGRDAQDRPKGFCL